MDADAYVRPRVACSLLHISDVTLRKWANQGKIPTIRTPSGQRLYHLPSVQRFYSQHVDPPPPEKLKFCYARVSSTKQMDDLKRQADFFKQNHPHHSLVADVGSGINWKRKGLTYLLEQSMQGNISEIVVAHKDRLCRFAFELLSFIFKQNNTQLIVLNQETSESTSRELADDILSIIDVYSCRAMGKRRYTSKKNQDLPKQEANNDVKELDGHM